MKKSHRITGRLRGLRSLDSGIFVASAFYIALAIYFYYPYLKSFKPSQYIIPINSIIAAAGCFVLSKRWVSNFAAKLIAGAFYGFLPFVLGFAAYHPAATVAAAILPWLFCPAVFWEMRFNLTRKTFPRTLITAIMSILPFIIILLLFELYSSAIFGPLFPIPKNTKLHLADFIGIISPQALKPHDFIFGFFHLGVAAVLMGLFMYLSAGRIGAVIIAVIALAMSFYAPIAGVSPVVWALIPILFGCVLLALGIQGLAWAGKSDSKWILICTVSLAVLAVVAYALSIKFGALYLASAKIHAASTLLIACIFFIARSGSRWHLLRWILLFAGLLLDLLLGARLIVDKIF